MIDRLDSQNLVFRAERMSLSFFVMGAKNLFKTPNNDVSDFLSFGVIGCKFCRVHIRHHVVLSITHNRRTQHAEALVNSTRHLNEKFPNTLFYSLIEYLRAQGAGWS